ncbi:MAG TPA: glycosyltransferase [Rhabdochlamydiaceae bacterium]|jgi:glycosyltransferase involved in cell wall biosynthesis
MLRTLSYLFFVALPLLIEAKQTICLNMIVKNESKVIKRCLDSVKSMIDYWVIVDTGSSDGTQKIIKKELKNIPGELYECPWKNFGENRSQAFNLAKGKGDYILFMDADDVLEFQGEPQFPVLTKDLYCMWRGTKDFQYVKPQIAKGNLPWRWVGVTHEYLDCSLPYTSEILQDVKYVTLDDGASTYDSKKFLKNIVVLEDGLKKEPDNHRYAFYLAESYRDAGDKPKALQCYQKRIDMRGWDEEVFWSHLQIAHILRDLGLSFTIVEEAFKNAHIFRPHRVEPIYQLAELYNQEGEYQKAYDVIKKWRRIPQPAEKDFLFNIEWMQHYGILFQFSICSYYVGQCQESLKACDALLSLENLPAAWRERAQANRAYPLSKLENNLIAEK